MFRRSNSVAVVAAAARRNGDGAANASEVPVSLAEDARGSGGGDCAR